MLKMLKIRLQRIGRKHEPKFRLVLTDSKNSTKSGKLLEVLGNFDTREKEKAVFKDDRIKHWMSVGAKATPTVHNVLIDKKIIEGKKINVLPKKRPIIKEENLKVESAKEESVKVEEVPEKAEEKVEENVA